MSRLASVAAAIAIGLTVACSSALSNRSPKGPTLDEDIDAQIARDNAIVWAQRRPLAWGDFKGPPPAEASPVAAQTHYALLHGAGCTGDKFQYRVVAAFVPAESWVRPSMLRSAAESARALRHEQTHFDITEVHARRLRRYYAELMAPCRIASGDLAAAASRIGRDERAAQAQYDAETDNGRTAAQQARWDRDIAAQLTALAKYTR
ncbi:MAG TPA: DUF922 domain-containing protein [Vicinamibacterales bacterium]|nr:DUF922 domain-containing protein [Vicinamibacterales bacterium]